MPHTSDFSSSLKGIPVSKVGSSTGVNIVDIAFGDYTFGRDSKGRITIGFLNSQQASDGSSYDVDDLIADVNSIHSRGGKVKLSFGGATFSMGWHIQSSQEATAFAQNVSEAVKQFGLDGIDFDVEDGNPSASIQLDVYKACRSYLGSSKLMSYTIPATIEPYDPWHTVLSQGHSYFDAVNVMAYDVGWSGYNFTRDDLETLEALGVPPSKVVYGVMPGAHDVSSEYTSVQDAQNIAKYVKSNGLAGVMLWDVNRDTNHRTGYSPGSNLYETGQPDGTYINAVSSSLN